ncbi:MAG: hypothetical protein ACOYBP_02175 [Microbacteriaceae bacterium]
MAELTDHELEELADRLISPETPMPRAGNVLTGDAAAKAGREFMIQQYGSESALEAALDSMLRAAGRPRLGEQARGASPTVRGRIPAADRVAFDRLILQTGKKESELVREAVHLLLEQHKLAS